MFSLSMLTVKDLQRLLKRVFSFEIIAQVR